MATPPLGAVLQHLRTITRPRPDAAHSDGQLLMRFLRGRDEAAFAALVARHGPLVLGVCRRVLAQRHDAEDAFQATFLVLIRKAASLDRQGSLANWLYTVAYRLACKIRGQAARRQARERQVGEMRPTETFDEPGTRDVLPILDEELQALPEKYRAPLVLCYLQGKSNAEAARELGWRPGSISRRLARGRDVLRQRLVKRGVVMSASALATLLAQEATAALPVALGRETVRAGMLAASGALAAESISASVASLVEGTVKEMFVLKLRVVAAMLLVILGVGAGAAVWPAPPAAPPLLAPPQATAEPPAPRTPPPSDGEEKVKTDLQGDPLPAAALRRFGTVRLRHGGPVASVAFSPDGKTAASGGSYSDSVIRLWDTATARELRSFKGHTPIHNSITGLAFTPDGKHLLSCALDLTVRLWDVATGAEVRQFRGHGAGVTGLALAADGKTLATASRDATVRLWDVATGVEQHTLAHTAIVNGVAFSPDGKMLAAAVDDGSVHLYDPATGKELKSLKGHAGGAYCVAFAPDSKSLASGGSKKDTTVRLWDVATAKELQAVEATNGPVQAIAFAPDGKSLAVGIDAKQVLVLDLGTGKPLRPFQGAYGIRSLVFSPDGKTLMTGSSTFSVTLLDVATGKNRFPFAAHQHYLGNLSFSPDGRTLRTCAQDQEVHVWDAAEGKEMRRFSSGPQRGKSTAYSPDGKLVAAASHTGVIRVFDLVSGKQVRQIGKNEGPIDALAWSADGKALAAGGPEGSVLRVWDAVGGKPLHDLGRQDGSTWSLAFSPDGKFLAAGREDRTVLVWDLASGKEQHRLTGPPGPIEAIAFSPDSRWLSAAPRGDTIWVWDPESGQQVAQLRGHTTWISAVEFSADGRTLASGSQDNTVRLWETATWKERTRFEGHRGGVVSLAFAPDGRTLASGSADSSALVWDLRGGRPSSTKPSSPELETFWSDLASDDATKAYRALGKLVAAPEQALPLVRNTLRPVPAIVEDRLKKLIADLDDDDFAVREKATDELAKVGGAADALLRRTLEGRVSAEQRRRIQHLLEQARSVGTTTDGLRQVRALELLEYVGTEEAKALLKELAKGAPRAPLTEQAKAALKRCER